MFNKGSYLKGQRLAEEICYLPMAGKAKVPKTRKIHLQIFATQFYLRLGALAGEVQPVRTPSYRVQFFAIKLTTSPNQFQQNYYYYYLRVVISENICVGYQWFLAPHTFKIHLFIVYSGSIISADFISNALIIICL